MSLSSNYLKEVRSQYENYPYPARNPEDEKNRLLETELSFLPILNHYCYGGKKDFNNFRVLIAGCGTGDAAIDFAVKLSEYENSSVLALDITQASLNIAKARAEVRELKNIEFIQASILDIPNLDLGRFDHINCSGVLHHLADPDAGLKALKSVLKEDGSMGLMLYAQYGRTGLYQMQNLMRLVNLYEKEPQTKVDRTKEVLKLLPETNWFKHLEGYFNDAKDDIGIYDLFLHSQDRAYTIPELYDFVESAGLHFSGFCVPYNKLLLRPEYLIRDSALLAEIKKLSIKDQQAFCELFIGAIHKHTFYVSMKENSCASLEDLKNIPCLFGFAEKDIHLKIAEAVKDAQLGQLVTMGNQYSKISFHVSEHSYDFFKAMDGQRSISEILDSIELGESDDKNEIQAEFMKLLQVLEDSCALYLI